MSAFGYVPLLAKTKNDFTLKNHKNNLKFKNYKKFMTRTIRN